MKGKTEMKLSCDMAMDLAPLYSDGCASKDTREAVREHLAGCERCRRYFAAVYDDNVIRLRRFLHIMSS